MHSRNATRTAALAAVAVMLLGGAQECDTSSGSGSKARDGGRFTKAVLSCSVFSGKLKATANGSGYPANVDLRVDFDIHGPGNFTVSENDIPGPTNGAGSWRTSDLTWTIPENGGGDYTLTVDAYLKGKLMGSDTDRCRP